MEAAHAAGGETEAQGQEIQSRNRNPASTLMINIPHENLGGRAGELFPSAKLVPSPPISTVPSAPGAG